MNLHFSNIDKGLITFYIVVIISATLAWVSARSSERKRH